MAYKGNFRKTGEFEGNRRGNFRKFPTQMHKINCSECGKEAEVPFKPIEGRPVYCKDCFIKRKDAERKSETVSEKKVKENTEKIEGTEEEIEDLDEDLEKTEGLDEDIDEDLEEDLDE